MGNGQTTIDSIEPTIASPENKRANTGMAGETEGTSERGSERWR